MDEGTTRNPTPKYKRGSENPRDRGTFRRRGVLGGRDVDREKVVCYKC